MALTIIRTDDADLTRVQQNVKTALDQLQAQIQSKKTPATRISADYAVQLTDVLVVAQSATDINVTLPAAGTCAGQTFMIKNKAQTDVLVRVRGQHVDGAFQLVEGVAPYDIPQGTCVTCYSTGTAWEVV
jgi:hypothetical protein